MFHKHTLILPNSIYCCIFAIFFSAISEIAENFKEDLVKIREVLCNYLFRD